MYGEMSTPIMSFLAPLALAALGLPFATALATRVGLVDKPDQRRKLHGRAVPMAGGMMVFFAVAAYLVYFTLTTGEWSSFLLARPTVFVPIAALFVIGLLDDRFKLPGKVKLLGQLGVAASLVCGGFLIQSINLFGWQFDVRLVALPLTVFWLIGSTNAVNLLDGMDGMVGTVGASIAAIIAGVALYTGHMATGITALAICGALVGFLLFNLPPARVFMGDAGSLTLGLTLGVLALDLESTAGRLTLGPLAIAALLLPILDSAAAFTRRALTGQSIFTTDRGHIHHRLRQAGLTIPQVLVLVAGLNILVGSGIFISTAIESYMPVAIATFVAGSILVLGRLFGHTECKLIARRLAHYLPISQNTRQRFGWVVRLQGSSRCWDEVWGAIRSKAGALNPRSVSFDINAPALHERFYARWDGPASESEFLSDWQVQAPVRLDGQIIGRLTVVAESCLVQGPVGLEAMKGLVAEVEEQIALHVVPNVAPAPRPAVVPIPRPGFGGRLRGGFRKTVEAFGLVPAMPWPTDYSAVNRRAAETSSAQL